MSVGTYGKGPTMLHGEWMIGRTYLFSPIGGDATYRRRAGSRVIVVEGSPIADCVMVRALHTHDVFLACRRDFLAS